MIDVAVMASGGGTDFQSIIDASESGEINAKVTLLITDNPDAYCVERAKKHDIDHSIIDHEGKSRTEHESEIIEILEENDPDLIVLAGYMRILTDEFVERYQGKLINIHPALLPLFGGEGMYGEKVHRNVLEAGMKRSGCSVHFVTSEVDGGPIIDQRCVPVKKDDDPHSLAERVKEKEHELLPAVVGAIAERKVVLEDGEAYILPEKDNNS
ncbi:MAG: phosphoribosylglycinamide formyltransferase [Candidatus Thermoplasmatota archaeon]|nr:phosphoribosylglycinamide formyltransferase [Candidatus Thermoplasmatota archaeon]